MAGGNIPGNLAPVFVQAGAQYHIPPQVLAGVASVESSLGQDRSTSSAGAVGLMQFLPSTARSIGINPTDDRQAIFGAAKLLNQYGFQQNPTRAIGAYNGGPGNPQYGYAQQVLNEANRLKGQLAAGSGGQLAPIGAPKPGPGQTLTSLSGTLTQTQPEFDQAGFHDAHNRYLAGSFVKQQEKGSPWDIPVKGASDFGGPNPLLASGLLTTQEPNPADFMHQVTRTYQLAQNQLQDIAGQVGLSVHPNALSGKGYVNPIPGFNVGRTDMGVDASARPGTPIRAIGDSKVVNIFPNWYSGQPYVLLQLLNGPKAGKYYYVAEQIAPSVHPGQVVHAGDPIGQYASQGTGIEIGWGTPGWQTLAQAQGNTGDSSHGNAPAGVDFHNFLSGLH